MTPDGRCCADGPTEAERVTSARAAAERHRQLVNVAIYVADTIGSSVRWLAAAIFAHALLAAVL